MDTATARGLRLAPPSLPPAAIARCLREDRAPLVLAPESERGWFSGTAVVAWDPARLEAGVDLASAAGQLQAAFDSEEFALVATLARYGGACTVARYAGALIRDERGWYAAGTVPDDAAEVLEAAASRCDDAALPPAAPLLRGASWDLAGREFRAAVEDVRQRIADGSVYVLNLTARLSGQPALSPAESFSAVVGRAGAEMSAYAAGWPGDTRWIASVSPERFVRVGRGEDDARVVEVCPIKGTRPRGATEQADLALAGDLAADAKELAEHIMVVDLERNDLGVSCVPGTVHVEPLYEIVATPYCHQLVSTVRGTLRSDAGFAELLSAAFPCGSVTGAPKRAAIRIADELERSDRGAYCGSLIAAVPGQLDSSVLIRTLEGVVGASSRARWGAGCGITYESDPVAEQLELLLKASPVTGNGAPVVALRETMRVAGDRVPLLDRHLLRLAGSGVGPTLLSQVRASVAQALGAVSPEEAGYARVRITVHPDRRVEVQIDRQPSSLSVAGGPLLHPVEVGGAPALPAAAAKPADRSGWDDAHALAMQAGAHQAALHLRDGTLLDGSTATIWLVTGGRLLTPPTGPAIAGVCRELVFDLAGQAGIDASEAPLTLADLDSADEVLLGNALGGLVAVRGRGGPVSAALIERVEAVLSGVKPAVVARELAE